jgi:hypothetical protein
MDIYGHRDENKRIMRTKAGLKKMARDRKHGRHKRKHNINQRNRKQKQSTKDAIEHKE